MRLVKKLLLAFIASALTLLLAMIVTEIYLRRRAAGTEGQPYRAALRAHDGRRISDKTGPVNLELAPYTIYRNVPSQRTANFSINSRGFRDDETIAQDSRPRLVFLGGSAVFGQGAATDSDTIPAILQHSLTSHRVLNAGITGFTSGQELALLVTDAIDYQPAIVVAYDGWNDVFDAAVSPARGENTLGANLYFFKMEDELAENYRTKTTFSGSMSRVFSLLSEKSLVIRRLGRAIHGDEKPNASRTIKDLAAAQQKDLLDRLVRIYFNNAKKMALVSQASGAKFLLVFQPELGQRSYPTEVEKQQLTTMPLGTGSYGDFFPELYRNFLAQVKPMLTQAGISWIDANESPLYQNEQQTLFDDPVHTNRRGNEIAAQVIFEKLQPLLSSK